MPFQRLWQLFSSQSSPTFWLEGEFTTCFMAYFHYCFASPHQLLLKIWRAWSIIYFNTSECPHLYWRSFFVLHLFFCFFIFRFDFIFPLNSSPILQYTSLLSFDLIPSFYLFSPIIPSLFKYSPDFLMLSHPEHW